MKVKPSNAACAPKRRALGDASSRANQSTANVTTKRSSASKEHEYKMPSLEEYMASTRRQFEEAQSFGQHPTVAPRNIKQPKAKSAATSSASSKKGKAETPLEAEIAVYTQNLDDIISPDSFKDKPMPSCQAVRNHIHKLLDAGIMTKAEFAKAIGCRRVYTLNAFLSETGPDGGSGNAVYYDAWVWFRQREVAKLKMPDVKGRQKQEASPASSSNDGSTSNTTETTLLPDISNIELEGEETDEVSVYDTCDEVRKKINAHLRTSGVTKAQFCRDIYAQLHQPKIKSIQSKQLSDFLRGKGPRTGAKSTVFYAAWVYFEKLRIASGKPKSKHRKDMEEIWAWRGGFDRTTDHRTPCIGSANC